MNVTNANIDVFHLAAIVLSSRDAVFSKSLDGTILTWNRSAERIYGYPESEAIGRSALMLTPPHLQAETREILQRVARGESFEQFETQRLRRDGTLFQVSITLSPIRGADEKIVAISTIARDITDRKRMEDQLRQEHQNLEKANQELDNFAHLVSHDLRSPLRGIMAFARLLKQDYGGRLNGNGLDYLNEIGACADRMHKLIEDLLSLTKIGRVRNPYEAVDLGELIHSVLQIFKIGINQNKVLVSVQRPMPIVTCDRIKINEVLINLVSNAIKFSSKNNPENPRVRIGYAERDGFYEFYVKDNGIGIAPEYHSQIFDMFRRLHTETEYEGTGAGLHIVKKIIEEHGGRVWVNSIPGKGATFYFTLPKVVRPSSAPAQELRQQLSPNH